MRLCSVEGCGRRRDAAGFCTAHYKRNLRYGDPLAGKPIRTYRRGRVCSVPGCGRRHDRHGYCVAHGKRFARYGTALPASPFHARPKRVAQVEYNALGEPVRGRLVAR